MSRDFKLTPARLKQIVIEEKKKLKDDGFISSKTVDDAWSGGDNLVHKIDYIKALGIKEAKLRKEADKISRLRRKIKSSIIKEI